MQTNQSFFKPCTVLSHAVQFCTYSNTQMWLILNCQPSCHCDKGTHYLRPSPVGHFEPNQSHTNTHMWHDIIHYGCPLNPMKMYTCNFNSVFPDGRQQWPQGPLVWCRTYSLRSPAGPCTSFLVPLPSAAHSVVDHAILCGAAHTNLYTLVYTVQFRYCVYSILLSVELILFDIDAA